MDRSKESWTLQVVDQQKFVHLETFIETGSFKGGGIQQALDIGFKHVHSVELDNNLYIKAESRFRGDSRVKCWHGDSKDVLPTILNDVKSAALVFLDSHSDSNTPLIDELQMLANCQIRHTIIIDDVDMVLQQIGWGVRIDVNKLYNAISNLPRYELKTLNSKVRENSQWLLTPIYDSSQE